MKFRDLKGSEVVSVEDAERLGTVDDVLLDLERHIALGFRVRMGGLFSAHQAVLLEDVQAAGKDAVTVKDATKLNDEWKFAILRDAVGHDGVVGSRVITEGGSEVGTIADTDIDLSTGNIVGYVLRPSILDRVQHREHLVPVSLVKRIGDRLVVIDDDVAPA